MRRCKRLLIASAACLTLAAMPFGLVAVNAGYFGAPFGEGVAVNHTLPPSPHADDSKSAPAPGSAVHALFDLARPETAPFPTDVFTVADNTHNTGRRVNLPYPDCSVRVSDCEDLDVI